MKTPREFDSRGRRIVTWTRTPAGRAYSRLLMIALNKRRHLRRKCGAKAKTTGLPCQQLAMENGRCFYHGGGTPKGDGAWHQPKWPSPGSPNADAKLERKLRELDQNARKRDKRLSAMPTKERARYRRWKDAHQPGSIAKRRSRKRRGVWHLTFEDIASPDTSPVSPELAELNRQRDQARHLLERLLLEQALSEQCQSDEGIFG